MLIRILQNNAELTEFITNKTKKVYQKSKPQCVPDYRKSIASGIFISLPICPDKNFTSAGTQKVKKMPADIIFIIYA